MYPSLFSVLGVNIIKEYKIDTLRRCVKHLDKEKQKEIKTSAIYSAISIILIILFINPFLNLFNHDKREQESAGLAQYEQQITISATDIAMANKTPEDIFQAVVRDGEYESVIIKNNNVELIIKKDKEKYWNKEIEKMLNSDIT